MIADLIAQAGIHSRVDGEFLQGGVGELFAGDFVRVLVEDESFEEARAVVDTWQATQVSMVKVEKNKPISFGSSKISIFIVLVIGALIGSGGVHSYYNTSETHNGIDHNRDGALDEKWTFLRGKMSKAEFDNNFDGELDQIVYYSSRGKIKYSETDLNHDGIMDTHTQYRNNNPILKKSDTNGDGHHDLFTYLKNRTVYKVEFYNLQTTALIKVQEFDAFKLISSKYDSTEDGTLDKFVNYGEYGEVKKHWQLK